MSAKTMESLTPREREVLTLIAKGNSLAEVAQKLHRSLKTIESHRLSLGRKLRASNRVELTHIAIAEGLITVKAEDDDTISASVTGMAQTELDWIKQINDAVFNSTGASFIKRFCDAASQLPGIKIAAVCTPDPTLATGTNAYQRYVIGMSTRGVSSDPIRYHAVGTPCETIINDGECCFSQGIADAYPDDAWLKQLKAESYIGIQLENQDGASCGGVGLVGGEPLEQIESYRHVVRFFAPRLAAELGLCLELNALRTRCDLLETQLEATITGSGREQASEAPSMSDDLAIALAQISRDVQSLAGPMFLRAMANSLCARLGIKAAGICMFVNRSEQADLASVMYSIDGQIQENFVYSPVDQPCEITLKTGRCNLPKDAQKRFPDDEYFKQMGIDAYIGVRLEDAMGQVVGTLWVCQTHEIQASEEVERIMRQFAPRIGAEVASFQRMEELLLEQEKLKRELSSRAKKAKARL